MKIIFQSTIFRFQLLIFGGVFNHPVGFGTPIWVVPKIGVHQNGWFIMENPIKWMSLGYPYFWKHQFLQTPKPTTPATRRSFRCSQAWISPLLPLHSCRMTPSFTAPGDCSASLSLRVPKPIDPLRVLVSNCFVMKWSLGIFLKPNTLIFY